MSDENAAAAEKSAAAAKAEARAARVDAEAASASALRAVDAKAEAELAARSAASSAAKNPWPLIVTAILTGACMVAAFYLGVKLLGSATSTAVTEATRRLQISALVCFLGMAFACLGFGLFLVGATGAFKGSSGETGKSSIMVETAAPGLVVMICATIVIYLALNVVNPPEPPAAAIPPPPTAIPASTPVKPPAASPTSVPKVPATGSGTAAETKPVTGSSSGSGSGATSTPETVPAAPP